MPKNMIWIKVQYKGNCRSCSRVLPTGSAAYWSPSTKGQIWCVPCGQTKKRVETAPAPSRPKERNDTRRPQTSTSQKEWERLCRYLRDCVQAEAADTLTYYNLQNKKWFLHRGGSESLIAGDADSISFPRVVLRKMKETQQPVTYGWPTLVAPDTKNHLQVAPLFIVTAEVDIEEGRLFADSEPEFNIGVTAGQLFDRSLYEEVKEIVGDGVPFGDAPSLVVLASRIRETLGLKMQSELDPETLDSQLGTRPGIYNAAVVIASESRFMYVASLVRELDSLSQRTDWVNTAAAWLLGKRPSTTGSSRPTEPLAAPLQTNHSQETILQHLRTSPLTVVKGPPGTGKTQLVANAASNAWLDRDRILVTSTNNGAVDVAAERAARAICPGLLLRTGNRKTREGLSEGLAEVVAEASLMDTQEAKARTRLAQAHSERTAFWENLEAQARLHEELLGTVERLEANARAIWGRERAPEMSLSPRDVAHQAQKLRRVRWIRRARVTKRGASYAISGVIIQRLTWTW